MVRYSPASNREVFHSPDVGAGGVRASVRSTPDPANSCFRVFPALTGLLTLDHSASATLNVANALHAEAMGAV